MTRMIRMLMAGTLSALTLTAATAARADGWHHTEPQSSGPVAQPEPDAEGIHYRRWEARRAWRELQLERERFYRHWRGNPWARARFERYYERRQAEMRARFGYGYRYGERSWRG
jgi:hypothetical protein